MDFKNLLRDDTFGYYEHKRIHFLTVFTLSFWNILFLDNKLIKDKQILILVFLLIRHNDGSKLYCFVWQPRDLIEVVLVTEFIHVFIQLINLLVFDCDAFNREVLRWLLWIRRILYIVED